MKRKIVVVALSVLLVYPSFTLKAQAQTELVAPCKDIPSCVVTGTVVIGGVIYYVIKNTATGLVRRVPAARSVPQTIHAHKSVEDVLNEPPRDRDTIEVPGLHSREQCTRFAQEYQKRHGGRWTSSVAKVAIPSPGTDDIPSRPLFKCAITRQAGE